ncbi:hypothetical protein HYW40_01955 [Candidatus Curtissbacteria bacterium]|nr:hypothetical protein [Candidatus Curtissbacteria bacterium]
MRPTLPDVEVARLKKRNRIKRLSPKVHKIAHESGRSTKDLWRRIVSQSKGKK